MFPVGQPAIPADVLKNAVVLGKYHRVAFCVTIALPHRTGSVRSPPSSLVVTVVTSMPRSVNARSMSRIARLGPPSRRGTEGGTWRTLQQPRLYPHPPRARPH